MAVSRLFCGNDTDLEVTAFSDASSGLFIDDADLLATVCLARTTGAIAAATNATPIVITSAGHGLETGHVVCVVNVGGNTAARGTWTITKLTDDTFSLDTSVGNADYTTGGRWFLAVDDVDAQEIPIELAGNIYRGILPGSVGLVEGQQYAVVFYATGDYRDQYNQVDIAAASLRGGNA